MLGLGFGEILIIALVALLVVGPDHLPEFAKSVAKFLNEMKRTAGDFKAALDEEKDIFKDDLDRFQKLSKDVKNFPEDHLMADLNSKKNIIDKTSLNHPEEEQLDILPKDHSEDFDEISTPSKIKE